MEIFVGMGFFEWVVLVLLGWISLYLWAVAKTLFQIHNVSRDLKSKSTQIQEFLWDPLHRQMSGFHEQLEQIGYNTGGTVDWKSIWEAEDADKR